jgi:hypothetical protein
MQKLRTMQKLTTSDSSDPPGWWATAVYLIGLGAFVALLIFGVNQHHDGSSADRNVPAATAGPGQNKLGDWDDLQRLVGLTSGPTPPPLEMPALVADRQFVQCAYAGE